MKVPFTWKVTGWWQIGWSQEFPVGEVRPLRYFDEDLVAWRGEGGDLHVLEAHCQHLGAHIGYGGKVVGDCVQCPFHHWEFDADGRCRRIPAACEIPAFARQMAFPAVERHGGVFVFNGAAPAYPLPFFDGLDPAGLSMAPPFTLALDCPWPMVGANGKPLPFWQQGYGYVDLQAAVALVRSSNWKTKLSSANTKANNRVLDADGFKVSRSEFWTYPSPRATVGWPPWNDRAAIASRSPTIAGSGS